MKVFVAGATGVIGKQLVPRLVAAGHEVVGMTRSESNRRVLVDLGATPVVADALDADQVTEAVGIAQPEVLVHELTAISSVAVRSHRRVGQDRGRPARPHAPERDARISGGHPSSRR